MSSQETNRIEFIDLAKGLCILLVLATHIVPEYFYSDLLGLIRMPLYFCISGMFFKDYGGILNFTRKKCDRILIPFIGWYLISYSWFYLKSVILNTPLDENFSFYDLFIGRKLFNNPIWFLLSLFWCNLIFSAVSRFYKTYKSQLTVILLISAVGWVLAYANTVNYLYIPTSLTCLPFFWLGYRLRTSSLLSADNTKHHDIRLFTLFLCIVVLLALAFPRYPSYLFYKNEIRGGNPLTIYLFAVPLVLLVLLMCKYVKKLPFISYIGEYSLIVLVTHMLLASPINKLINFIFGADCFGKWESLVVLIALLLSMLIVIPICKRILPYITAQKELLKDYYLSKKEFMETSHP